jgi:GNAT superfamily N-acetyltransferase
VTATVRPIAAGDAESWRPLFTAYGAFYETDFTDEILDRVWALLLDAASGVDGLVAEDEHGDVVGFAHYRSHPDTFTGGRDWFLDDLYVTEEARGLGAATALIQHLTTLARASSPAGTLRWITADDNHRAQRVYDRLAKRTTWVTYEVRL